MVTIEWNAKAVRGYPKLLKNLKRALKADGIFTATITLTRVPIEKE